MVAVGALTLIVLVVLMVHTRSGARYDHDMEWSLGGPPWLFTNIERRLEQISVTTIALSTAVLGAIALCRRRIGLAVGALLLVAGATITTQVLKDHLIHALPGNTANSLPSGHATVGVSISLALLLVLPASWQRLTLPICSAVGFFFGAGTVIGHWHHPSDVLAALGVCLAWAGVAMATAYRLDSARTRPARRPTNRAGRAGLVRPAGPQPVSAAQACWLVLGGIALISLLFLAWGAQPSIRSPRALTLGLCAVGAIAGCTLLVYTWVSRVARAIED